MSEPVLRFKLSTHVAELDEAERGRYRFPASQPGGTTMKAVYYHEAAKPPEDLIGAVKEFPQVTLLAAGNPDELREALKDCEVLIVNNRSYTADNAKLIRDHGSALKWIQFSTSGIDNALKNGMPSNVVVTNIAGLRAFAVAEHALMLMLGLVRRVRATEQARKQQTWARDEITPSMDNLAGKQLLILGLGAIGQEIARKAKAFDMKVTGISRSTESVPNVDRVLPRSEIKAACADADIVAIAAGADAGQLLDREAIAALKPGAFVINIARGALADEAALIDALENGKIAGAGFDVMATEPLPKGHAFWAMENVIMTPHVAGAGNQGTGGGLGSIFADNLRRWFEAKPLAKVLIARTP
jgi:phosphoglycerate dehydrogenase-like enzyme